MTINTFITKYNGKKLDWDNAYGGQCTDLFRFYVHEVLNLPQPKPVVGAADFWTNYDIDPNLKNNFEKILNTPVNVPKAGDVMIWNKKAGGGGRTNSAPYGTGGNGGSGVVVVSYLTGSFTPKGGSFLYNLC